MSNGKMLYRSRWRFGGRHFLSEDEHWYGSKLMKRTARRKEERGWRREHRWDTDPRWNRLIEEDP